MRAYLIGLCVVGATSLQLGRSPRALPSMIRSRDAGIMMASDAEPPDKKVVVVTHAGGRMGTLLVAQLREEFGESVSVRAIVRSEAESEKLLCDIYGVKLVNGSMAPLVPSCGSWLTPIVMDADCTDDDLLKAFTGATSAVLCDALHTELVAADGGSNQRSMRVPQGGEQARRLPRMLKAASSASASLAHVVLRSSMGISCAASCAPSTDPESSPRECDADAMRAIDRMGGPAILATVGESEEQLASSGLPYTVLRLGALTDDAGMIPLAFGANDDLLLQSFELTEGDEPPMISRADAARAAISVLQTGSPLHGATFECSWDYKWARSSIGTEEAVLRAARQDMRAGMLEAARGETNYRSI